MFKKQRLLAAVLLGLQLPGRLALAAPEVVEPWVYNSIEELAAAGYLELPGHSLGSFSREELAGLVAGALKEMENNRLGSKADKYALLTRLEVMDRVQLKLAREQLHFAEQQLGRAKHRAERAAEMFARRSMEGQNRLEVMEPLKQKNDEAQKKLAFAARDYAEARSRVSELEGLWHQVQEMQKRLLEDMGGETGESLTAPTVLQEGKSYQPGRADYADDSIKKAKPEEAPVATLETAGRLRAEFAGELEAAGSLDEMNAARQLSSNLPIKNVPDQRFKLDTELRYDAGYSDGIHGNGNRTRARVRMYPDYNIDGNWHARGMAEWEKTLSGPQGSKDGKVRLDRYYLSGDMGTVHTDAGVFSSLMAEGNIYDSKFKGVRFALGKPVRYTLEAGKAGQDGVRNSFDLVASYEGAGYGLDGGIYRFGFEGGSWQNIYMVNYRHNLGILDAGAMALYGKESGGRSKGGYVLTLGYKPANSWKPYTWNGWVKYYYQPSPTYLAHTMNGRADAMKLHGGFRGLGAGVSYNLPHDWSLGLEYYALKDLDYGHSSHTIWGSVTKSFKNYRE